MPSGLIVKATNKVTVDDRMVAVTGVTQQANNWLLLAEAAGGMVNTSCVVCMLRVVPALLPPHCLLEVMTRTILSKACKKWDGVYPLTKAAKEKPIFSDKVAMANFSCIELSGSLRRVGNLDPSWCKTTVYQTSPLVPRSDVWWWCGGSKLYDTLRNSVGVCALVSLLLSVYIYPVSATDILDATSKFDPSKLRVNKRSAQWAVEPTYIDAIGVPRGVPSEYRLTNPIASGFESVLPWITVNKNVERINYIHFNLQRLNNNSEIAFTALKHQLDATSLMAFQTRVAVDMLLAEKGGVCGHIDICSKRYLL
ncbi:uncharacterized protein LOC130930406 [Corythoichthys intestinalis]|uniref:uncharacterized protein LOC130930406 n=1 Tax=Corythoichthys intestinalis TaxID=161448 RepID=UPI0025A60546|nr:uncharacterized protein LOC130930406 [Corythoichthys intestinalis]XP_057714345.1 uncharacterized protein LOC130930406 [Corythoichthys intestinalis]